MTKSSESSTNQKLLSLLALSAGALALPGTSDANIIYTPNVNAQVGFSPGFGSNFTLNLPGSNDIKLWRQFSAPVRPAQGSFTSNRKVHFGNTGGGGAVRSYLPGGGTFVKRTIAGKTWSQIPNGTSNQALVGHLRIRRSGFPTTTTYSPKIIPGTTAQVVGPGAFTQQYVAFAFKDTTDGNQVDYGWALLSMAISGGGGPGNPDLHPPGPGVGLGPDVTLLSYAFDDSGAPIQTGQTQGPAPGGVPEPTSLALGALGALILGAPALRRWRAQKKAQAATA